MVKQRLAVILLIVAFLLAFGYYLIQIYRLVTVMVSISGSELPISVAADQGECGPDNIARGVWNCSVPVGNRIIYAHCRQEKVAPQVRLELTRPGEAYVVFSNPCSTPPDIVEKVNGIAKGVWSSDLLMQKKLESTDAHKR